MDKNLDIKVVEALGDNLDSGVEKPGDYQMSRI